MIKYVTTKIQINPLTITFLHFRMCVKKKGFFVSNQKSGPYPKKFCLEVQKTLQIIKKLIATLCMMFINT